MGTKIDELEKSINEVIDTEQEPSDGLNKGSQNGAVKR